MIQHHVVYHDPDAWAACTANCGTSGPTWQWDDEILVGFTRGEFQGTEPGHQVDDTLPLINWLARSRDGGETWNSWVPENFAGQGLVPTEPASALDFASPGFLIRVEGNGYHGNAGAHWFHSDDRGASWQGPFHFGDLLDHPELTSKEFTGRTAYFINGPRELFLFLSVRLRTDPSGRDLQISLVEKTFLARTTDGGRTFSFVSWVVPWDDPNRGAVPAPARVSASKIVTAIRRKSASNNWIDCYHSEDNGTSWSYLSKVANTEEETGPQHNGNPPSLLLLEDGRLCCAYGVRSFGDQCIAARYSEDEGLNWSVRHVLRNDFESINGMSDLGYVRLFQRPDGKCVAVYFWCTPQRPQTHIEATIFDPHART
ncbi:MAG: hypothetical protein CMJ18_09000 [Phycisphaeraceae bacterium]|nr:hypothetical protein [Phycisphaeraceae bacterium]